MNRNTENGRIKTWNEISMVTKRQKLITKIGYNPEQLRTNIERLNVTNKCTNLSVWNFHIKKADNSKGTIKYRAGDFQVEMKLLIIIYLSMGGSSIEDIIDSFDVHLKPVLRRLVKKYRVEDPRNEMPPYLITLPRMAYSFSTISANAFNEGYGKISFNPETIFPGCKGIPRAIFYQHISCCIPHYVFNEDVIPQLLLIEVIRNNNSKSKTSLDILAENLMYNLSDKESSRIYERAVQGRKLQLIVNDRWRKELLKFRTYAINRIRKLRNLENLDSVFRFFGIPVK